MTQDRQRLIRLIHVAKRDLSMDDDTYRALLLQIGKTTTSADLSTPELEKVLAHLKRCGFRIRSKKLSRPLAQDATSQKIRALWLFLHELGVVKNPSEEALASYVKRITDVDALQWTSNEQAERLIETLKKWSMRFLPQMVKHMTEQTDTLELPDPDRKRLNAVLNQALAHQTFEPMRTAWEHLNDVLKKGK